MMTPALRRFTFTTHITSSVGWVGAALAFLALAVIGFTSDDPGEGPRGVPPDGAGGVVCPRSLGACIAAQRHRLVAGHDVGAVLGTTGSS